MTKLAQFILPIILMFSAFSLRAQIQKDIDFEKFAGLSISLQYDEDVNIEQLYENLIQVYQEPINLNSANIDELKMLFFLSDRQINNIIRYREFYGDFLSIYELALVPSLDQQSIHTLLPFIKIEKVIDRKLALKKRWEAASQRYLIVRQSSVMNPKEGYLSDVDSISEVGSQALYSGSPHQLYSRLRISNPGSFSLGITVEKDAGEKIDWNTANKQYGADFVSAHFQLEKLGPFEQITFGDFQFQSGQQMVFGGGLNLGKGAMTTRSVGRSIYGVRPYTASTENGFMRGSTISMNLPLNTHHLVFTALYSSLQEDARLEWDSISQQSYFTGFNLSGLHRSDSEQAFRKQVNAQNLGGNLHFTNRFQNFQLGLNFLQTNYSHDLIPKNQLYKLKDFSGSSHQMGSLYTSYQSRQWRVFSESAFTSQHAYGFVAGLSAVLSSYAESVWLYRKYSEGFYNPYGNAFGENSRNTNEEGLYWGLKLDPLPKLKVDVYYDVFRFSWLKYRVDAPSRGYEYLFGASYQLNSATMLNFRYRMENKESNQQLNTSQFNGVAPLLRKNLVFSLFHTVNEHLNLKTRFHSGSNSNSSSLGWVVAQDVSYTLGRWKVDARFAMINTSDYDNRQYLYENDLLYTFSVPAYSGQGVKYYLLLRYKMNRHLSSWLRVGSMSYYDRETIGSGAEEIMDNQRTQLKTQLIYKF